MQHERLSALMDDELPAQESARLIDDLSADPQLKRMWARYHMIGAVLRTNAEGAPAAVAVSDAHDGAATNVVVMPARDHGRRLLGGLAIAASVAALAVTLTLRLTTPEGEPDFRTVEAAQTPLIHPQPVAAVAATAPEEILPLDRVADPSGEYERRFDGYLVNFNEQRVRLGVPGVHPYVRIVGFEPQ